MLSAYLNFHDLIFVGIVGVVTWRRRQTRVPWYQLLGFAVFVFGLVLPFTSMQIEIAIQRSTHGPNELDGFNLWYTFFRFPVYWVLGATWIISSILVKRRYRRRQLRAAWPDDDLRIIDR